MNFIEIIVLSLILFAITYAIFYVIDIALASFLTLSIMNVQDLISLDVSVLMLLLGKLLPKDICEGSEPGISLIFDGLNKRKFYITVRYRHKDLYDIENLDINHFTLGIFDKITEKSVPLVSEKLSIENNNNRVSLCVEIIKTTPTRIILKNLLFFNRLRKFIRKNFTVDTDYILNNLTNENFKIVKTDLYVDGRFIKSLDTYEEDIKNRKNCFVLSNHIYRAQ